MSRLNISFPWQWNSLSGVQAAQKLDDDYNAVPAGDITIRTYVLAASYTLTANDEFSFFLCVPTVDMTLSLPSSPGSLYSFWVSNQSATHTVTIVGTIAVNGTAPTLNTVLQASGHKGGLVVWNGSSWSLYTSLFS